MEPFKNVFSPALVSCLANHLSAAIPSFESQPFVAAILGSLGSLEFKQRAQLIADHVHKALPNDPAERARMLLTILHPDEYDHANQPSE